MLKVRPAQLADSQALYEIANHPEVRGHSLSPDSFSFTSHQLWFEKALQNSALLILVGMLDTELIGYLRFKKDKREATISIALTPTLTSQGLGTGLLRDGIPFLKKKWPDVKNIIAIVKKDNPRSQAFFEKNKFVTTKNNLEHDTPLREYHYEI